MNVPRPVPDFSEKCKKKKKNRILIAHRKHTAQLAQRIANVYICCRISITPLLSI